MFTKLYRTPRPIFDTNVIKIFGAVFFCKKLTPNLIYGGNFEKIGVDFLTFQNFYSSCLLFDPKQMFGVKLVNKGSVVYTAELDTGRHCLEVTLF